MPRPVFAILWGLLVLVGGCNAPPDGGAGAAGAPGATLFHYEHDALDRTFRVSLYAASASIADSAAAAAFARVDEIDALTRPDHPDSELAQLIAGAGGPWQKVGDQLFRLLQQSLRLSDRSDGAFDATSAPMADLWREHFAARTLPSEQALLDVRARCGWRKLQVDAINRQARLLLPGMQLDLRELAVGYAADSIIQELNQRGIERARVDAGTVIVAAQAPPDAAGWPVLLPDSGQRRAQRLHLRNGAVAFAGDGQVTAVIGVDRFSERVDPRTGLGLPHAIAATAFARRGLSAAQVAAAAIALLPNQRAIFSLKVPGARIRYRESMPD